MRTLFISETIPYPLTSGRNQRVFHLLKAVAEVSEVTLVCPTPNGDPSPDLEPLRPYYRRACLFPLESFGLYRLAKMVRPLRRLKTLAAHLCRITPTTLDWWRSPEGGRLVECLTREQFDLVWAERLLGLGLLPPGLQTRVVVDLDDLEHRKLGSRIRSNGLRLRLPFDVLEFLKLRRFERSLPLWGYELLVCSELDRQIIGAKPNVLVVPNGVDVPPLRPAPAPNAAAPTFLFVGTMSYLPNIEAVQFFTRCIFPHIRRELPDAQFWIVGRDPVEEVRALHDGSSILVTGGVPKVELYLRDAAVVVVPLRSGAGTRLKILEAMAHCRPVVSTRIGVEGLEVEAGTHLLVEDDPIAFAQACLRLLADREERQRLTIASYELVRERYDWKHIEGRVRGIVTGQSTSELPSASAPAFRVPISGPLRNSTEDNNKAVNLHRITNRVGRLQGGSEPRSLTISVIIPAYNTGSYLNQALDSVLSQASAHFQLDVVVVDDGSTDNTEEVSRSYRNSVRYFRIAHCGLPGVVRNYGLKEARGDLVAFLDADDFWLPGSLERRVEILESQPEVGFVYGNYFLLQGERQWLGFTDQDPPSGSVFKELFRANFINTDTVLARRQLVEESDALCSHTRTAGDYWLWLQLAKRTTVAYIPDPLAVYRLRSGSVSGIPLTEKIPNLIFVLTTAARQFRVPSALVYERLNPLRVWLAKELFRNRKYWRAMRWLLPAFWTEPKRMVKASWSFAKKQVHRERCRETSPVR